MTVKIEDKRTIKQYRKRKHISKTETIMTENEILN